MAHISSIGAGIYASLSYVANDADADTAAEFLGLTTTEVTNIRDFPSFGSPANIVNVPVYGQPQSSQVAGQADAPTLEFTLNYVPEDHAALNGLVGNGNVYIFRIRLANSDVPHSGTVAATTEHTDFYVRGSFASFTVAPNLTDSNQATLTLATQGNYFGPFTTS